MASQSSQSTISDVEEQVKPKTLAPDMSQLPPIFLLAAHLNMEELHSLEDTLQTAQAPLTYDSNEGQLFIGKVTQKRRAVIELRGKGVVTEEVTDRAESLEIVAKTMTAVRASATEDLDKVVDGDGKPSTVTTKPDPVSKSAHLGKRKRGEENRNQKGPANQDHGGIVQVIKLSWLEDSVAATKLLDLKDYVVYTGRRALGKSSTSKSPSFVKPTLAASQSRPDKAATPTSPLSAVARGILERAQAENGASTDGVSISSFLSTTQLRQRTATSRHAQLVHQTTSEHDLGHSADLPNPPDWVKRHSTYSCERATPLHGPNEPFVDELKKIRLARELTADEIGVRAYSTSIASLQAYPYTVTDQREILALPGCDYKIAGLWVEWKNRDGLIHAVEDVENDPHLQVLRLFYDIWGVGAHTAREFYNKNWRDLDDVVEFGWKDLSRVQQIGVKYYEEFKAKIPRSEVEFIGAKVHEHAQRVREASGVRTCIVGGYRRGKTESGDVDVIVSHIDEEATLDIVTDIVKSLFEEGWITHELTTTLSNTRRSQATLPFRPDGSGGGRSFDTLDKSLVVWQDPNWEGKEKGGKNPNVHRRVDIIICPWSRVGTGVLGWTAATTFERDLRRYAKRFKGWKFDSSGIRDRTTGEEIDLEAVGGRCTTINEAERKVFKGLGLVWREPWERCAG